MTSTPRNFDDWYVEIFNSRTGASPDEALLEQAAWNLAENDDALQDSFGYLGDVDATDPELIDSAEALASERFDCRSVFGHVHYVALCALYLDYRASLEKQLVDDPAAT